MQAINIVLAVYKPEHLEQVRLLCTNLLTIGHTNITIATSQEYERGVKPLIGNGDGKLSVSGVILTPESDPQFMQFAADPLRSDAARLWAWMRAIGILEFGTPFVCLDIESLVFRPFTESWNAVRPYPFTLAMAQKVGLNGRLWYIPRLLYGNVSPIAKSSLDLWSREILRLYGRSDRANLETSYGSILGASFNLLKSQMDEGGGAILGVIPPAWVIEKPPVVEASGVLLFPHDPKRGFDGYEWFPVIRTLTQYKEQSER